MKKIFAFFLIFALLLVTIPVVSATDGETILQYDFKDGNNKQHRYYYIDNGDGTCRFHSYLGSARDLSIPNEINGLVVTTIDDNALAQKTTLTSVRIPDTVLSIGIKAFSGCTGLTSVVIGKSVRAIFNQGFEGCSSLTGININNVEFIGKLCFSNCISMTSFRSSNKLTYISENAFQNCSSLNFIYFSNTLETISDYAFKDCIALTTVSFPASVKNIGRGAFQGCTAVEKINFGTANVVIGDYAFENCLALIEVTIPQTVVSVGSHAFQFREEEAVQSTATHPVKIICSLGSAGVPYAVASGATVYITELGRDVLFGDIDGNGIITLEDAISILRITSNMEPPLSNEADIFYYDLNGNGYLDIEDARTVLKRAANVA